MRRFRIWDHSMYSSNFAYKGSGLPVGVCLNPECPNNKEAVLLKCKYGANCAKCKIRLNYRHASKKFTQKRRKELGKVVDLFEENK